MKKGILACWILLASLSSLNGENSHEGRTVRSVSIESRIPFSQITEADLWNLIPLKAGEAFTAEKAQATILQLYATDLFFDIQIDAEEVDGNQIDLTIRLIRKIRIRKVSFQGSLRIKESLLRNQIYLREGAPFSEDTLKRSIASITSLYSTHGFYHPRIEAAFERPPGTAFVQVAFSIEAGDQAKIKSLAFDVEGDYPLESLAEQIESREGEGYSNVQIEKDLEKLEAFLRLQGYLRPEVYLKGGARLEESSNSVALTIRVIPRTQTRVEFEGIDLSQSRIHQLPVYQLSPSSTLRLEETSQELAHNLQKEGYFQAKVEYETEGDDSQSPTKVIFKVNRGPAYKTFAVEFSGNRMVSTDTLNGLLRIKTGGLFSGRSFSDDLIEEDLESLRTYYGDLGYLNTQIERRFETREQLLVLILEINEGPQNRVQSVEFRGNRQFSNESLLRQISLREGAPFSPAALAADRANLMAYYANAGYRQVDVDALILESADARSKIAFQIEEGSQYFVGNVVVMGNRNTKRQVILRELLPKPGGELSLDQILQSESNLYALSIFDRVSVRELPVLGSPFYRTLLFNVEEARKYSLVYGVGYSHSFGTSTSEGWRGTFGVTNSNFLGSARTLSLSLRAGSRRQRGNLSYTLQRPFGIALPTIVSLTVDRENRFTDADSQTPLQVVGRPYDSFRIIASSQSEKRLSRRESLFFHYDFEKVRLNVPGDLAAPLQLFREEERLSLSTVGLSYLNDSRSDTLNPTSGFLLKGETELSARQLGSSEQFLQTLAQALFIRSPRDQLTFATSLRIGIIAPFGSTAGAPVRNPIPISERFFAGGPTSLRGLPLDLAGPLLRDAETGNLILVNQGSKDKPDMVPVPLGGNAMAILNTELRYPSNRTLGMALFYDLGNVFDSMTDLSVGLSNAVGLGFFVKTPVGPIRLDVAYNPKPPESEGFSRWNFHINLGHPF